MRAERDTRQHGGPVSSSPLSSSRSSGSELPWVGWWPANALGWSLTKYLRSPPSHPQDRLTITCPLLTFVCTSSHTVCRADS